MTERLDLFMFNFSPPAPTHHLSVTPVFFSLQEAQVVLISGYRNGPAIQRLTDKGSLVKRFA